MKIVSTFVKDLFAVQYDGYERNELARNLELWNDVEYVFLFLKDNEGDLPLNTSIKEMAEEIIELANEIEDILLTISGTQDLSLETFFKPLNNQEYLEVLLSKQKGRNHFLRLYAIRIDESCFLITGGAIKLTLLMQDRSHTKLELSKIEKCRNYLFENGITDYDSFYEFLTDQI